MAMKKMYNTPHRGCIVKTRLTKEERQDFEEKCRTLSISQSEYLRQAIFSGKVSTTIRVTANNEEMLTAVSNLVAQYGKIGSNLNQIASTTLFRTNATKDQKTSIVEKSKSLDFPTMPTTTESLSFPSFLLQ